MSILDHLYNFEVSRLINLYRVFQKMHIIRPPKSLYFISPQVLPLLNPGYFIISILAALLQLVSAAGLLLISYTDKMKANYA